MSGGMRGWGWDAPSLGDRRPIMSTKIKLDDQQKTALVATLPALICMIAIIGFPLLTTLKSSVFKESLINPMAGSTLIGFTNFITLAIDPGFWSTLLRTTVWTLGSVLGKSLIGLLIAVLLNKEFRGNAVYRVLLLVPWATPQVIGAIVWKWIFNGQYGMLNYYLMKLGILSDHYSWLGNTTSAFLAAMVVDMWRGVPFMAIVFLAGLQSIPNDIYQAASVDGAGSWHKFRFITMPLLIPVLLAATTLSIIWTFNSFNIIWTMTGGGPLNATEILVVKTYREAFSNYDVGMSSAYATVTLIILMAFSILYWRILRRGGEQA